MSTDKLFAVVVRSAGGDRTILVAASSIENAIGKLKMTTSSLNAQDEIRSVGQVNEEVIL